MSTAIYKVSDGSTITFKTRGPELYAVLSTPSGQVINGPSRMGNTEEKAAREILLANNIVDPNNGEPLTYTIEGAQDVPNETISGEIPRLTMFEATDQTALNIAKTNKEIMIQDNEALNSSLEADLPPDVKFVNLINDQKSTIKKRLIPFIIDLITPFAPQVIPLVVSNLGISGDSSIDSIQDSVKSKTDEAKAKADDAKGKAEEAKDNATDDDPTVSPALKAAAIAAAAGGAVYVIGRLDKSQLLGLLKDCPSSSKLQTIIKQRNALVTQINGMYNIITRLTLVLGITTTVISALKIGIQLAESNPYPATGIPPLGLPPITAGLQAKISSFIAKIEDQIKIQSKNISTITITVASFAGFLGIILKFLKVLDVLLQTCAANANLEQVNDDINALANPTVVATQNNSDNQNINTYKGFTLGVKIDETNDSKYIRRYAVAQNKQGVDVLKTDSSFASDPAVLISQLKFIIDITPNITAE
jgi:hypothetical protein